MLGRVHKNMLAFLFDIKESEYCALPHCIERFTLET